MDLGNLAYHKHHHLRDSHVHQCSAADMRSDAVWKAISIAAIYAIGMLFCILPIALRSKFSRSQHYTSYLGMANSFGAGVFLSLGLIHLLPEGEERLAEYYGAELNAKYRLCYVMCAIGYACILMLERVVFTTPTCAHHMHKKVHQEDASFAAKFSSRESELTAHLLGKHQQTTEEEMCFPTPISETLSRELETADGDVNISISPLDDGCIQGSVQPCDVEGSHIILRNRERIVAAAVERESIGQCLACEQEKILENTPTTSALQAEDEPSEMAHAAAKAKSPGKLTQERLSSLGSSINRGKSLTSSLALDGTTESMIESKAEALKGSNCPSNLSTSDDAPDGQTPSHTHAQSSTLQPYVLMAALSAHGLSEGLALGVERGTRNIILLFLAIMAHKWAEGLALGISFSKTVIKSKRVIGLLLAFSLSTPVGVAIGWLAQALMPACAEGYFLGFSSGSFLYIGASEVVVEEFIQGQRHWGKFSCFLAGVGLIYLISIYL
ncbi:Zinc transporter family protein [Perkinsela sp. CCAP 1560/4]|nr:Zinc transporter family protein [Perkinsela sp. CCAP 1560/4]|eukprot:KNH06258.1 Zinc transporter family protein [Perkinsela sp. CCAP 1560/4]